MSKNALKYLLFGLILLVPGTIKANCSYEDKIRLQKIASNVSLSYRYELNANQEMKFTITITNLHPDIYVIDQTKKKTYYYTKPEITNTDYSAGVSAAFDITSNLKNCKGELLLTNYVAIPYYNKFYSDSLCKGIEDYKLCQRFSRIDLSYESFVKDITAYKESLMKKPNEENKLEENKIITAIINFLGKYSTVLFGGIIVICGATMFYLIRKDDFDLKIK